MPRARKLRALARAGSAGDGVDGSDRRADRRPRLLCTRLPLGAQFFSAPSCRADDPVLATDVQIRHPVTVTGCAYLTCEAGINDGTLSRFVMLGWGCSVCTSIGDHGLRWVMVDVLWATSAGIGLAWCWVKGWAFGMEAAPQRRTHTPGMTSWESSDRPGVWADVYVDAWVFWQCSSPPWRCVKPSSNSPVNFRNLRNGYTLASPDRQCDRSQACATGTHQRGVTDLRGTSGAALGSDTVYC